MYRISAVVVSLVCALPVLTAPGAAAREPGLSLAAPIQIGPSSYRLKGMAPKARRAVVLQRRVDGRWVKVRRLRVVDRVYRTKVRAVAREQRYRTVAGPVRSRMRTVPARPRPSTAPSTPPDEAGPIVVGPVELGPVELGNIELGAADACGAPLYRTDGSRRACTFADDFDDTELNRAKWVPQTNFITGEPEGAYACYRDHPDNVSAGNGVLKLTLRKEPAPVACAHPGTAPSRFTAGGVMTYHLFSQRYGRFEARLKNTATSSPGLHEAFWLWPDDRQNISVLWPAAGEIDIVETYSLYPYHAIPFLHYTYNDNGGPVPGVNTAWDCGAARGVWNTYALEWTPQRLEIFVNGDSCLVNTSGDSAFQRAYIIALTQGIGVQDNRYTATTPLPASMFVDYVHVWN